MLKVGQLCSILKSYKMKKTILAIVTVSLSILFSSCSQDELIPEEISFETEACCGQEVPPQPPPAGGNGGG